MVILGEPVSRSSVRSRARRTCACSSSSIRAAGLVHGGPQPVRGPAPDGHPAAREHPAGGPGDARSGHRGTGRGGVRRGNRASRIARGHGPQLLHRPDVHPALAGAAPARRASQALAASARSCAASASSWWTTPSSAAPPRRQSVVGLLRKRGGECRSTSGSARRRSSIPASTASTRDRDGADRGQPSRSTRSATSSARTRSATCRSAACSHALDLPYDRFCFACFDGNYPVPRRLLTPRSRKLMLETRRARVAG